MALGPPFPSERVGVRCSLAGARCGLTAGVCVPPVYDEDEQDFRRLSPPEKDYSQLPLKATPMVDILQCDVDGRINRRGVRDIASFIDEPLDPVDAESLEQVLSWFDHEGVCASPRMPIADLSPATASLKQQITQNSARSPLFSCSPRGKLVRHLSVPVTQPSWPQYSDDGALECGDSFAPPRRPSESWNRIGSGLTAMGPFLVSALLSAGGLVAKHRFADQEVPQHEDGAQRTRPRRAKSRFGLVEQRDARQRISGAVCLQVNYDEGPGPAKDVPSLFCSEGHLSRRGCPRIFAARLSHQGSAQRAGVRCGDELVLTATPGQAPRPPAKGAASLLALDPPCTLFFMSFAGRYPAELKLKNKPMSVQAGVHCLGDLQGPHTDLRMYESVVFRPSISPLLLFSGSGGAASFYELIPDEARELVIGARRALDQRTRFLEECMALEELLVEDDEPPDDLSNGSESLLPES